MGAAAASVDKSVPPCKINYEHNTSLCKANTAAWRCPNIVLLILIAEEAQSRNEESECQADNMGCADAFRGAI